MAANSPTDRALIARAAAHARWAKTDDRVAASAPGRKAAEDRFERQVDPDGTLPAQERAKRAASARKAFFAQLALASVRARRARSAA